MAEAKGLWLLRLGWSGRRYILSSRMMRRTVAAQGMMGRQMAQRMMGWQAMLRRGRRRRRRGFLCDGVTGKGHGKRDRGDKGLHHGDIPSPGSPELGSEIECYAPSELPMNTPLMAAGHVTRNGTAYTATAVAKMIA